VIYLAFRIAVKTNSEVSQLIAAASGSPYSHVEGWLRDDRNRAYCFSSREPYGCSFKVIDLTTPEWVTLPLTLTAEQEARIQGFCEGASGKAYDFPGIAGYETGTGLHNDSDLFCSECWATALKRCAGWTLDGKDPWMISPGGLYTLAGGK